MKRLALLIFLLALTGCASVPSARGSRLLPWNWFSSDSTAALSKAEHKEDLAKDDLRRLAQEFIASANAALAAEKARQLAAGGTVSTEVTVAGDMTGRAGETLAQSEGALAPAKLREAERMVALLTSQLQAERAAGAQMLGLLDRTVNTTVTRLDAAGDKIAGLQTDVKNEQQRALVAEAKYNKLIFWVGALVLGWLLLQLLPLLSAVFPALAPVAHVAGMVIAPAVQAGYNRMKSAIGSGIHAVETVSTAAAAALRAELDPPLTLADQAGVAAHYATTAGTANRPLV